MFINRVSNPNLSDTWYAVGSTIRPAVITDRYVETHPFRLVEDHFKSLYPRNASNHKNYLSEMLARYNPQYEKADGQFIQGISVILALKNCGLESELNNVLLELEL